MSDVDKKDYLLGAAEAALRAAANRLRLSGHTLDAKLAEDVAAAISTMGKEVNMDG